MIGTLSDWMFSDGTFSDEMFSDGMFCDGSFSDGTFSDGACRYKTFCMTVSIRFFFGKNIIRPPFLSFLYFLKSTYL